MKDIEGLPTTPGTMIAGKYRVEHLLAAGGMGAVLLAHHEVLDKRVAIKVMRPELAGNREAAQRFLREARAAAKIASDYVAAVTDVDLLDSGAPFMVMDFLDGLDLSDFIKAGTPLPPEGSVDFIMQALSGLDAAHHLGVVHRDLKPSNLFLAKQRDGSMRVKILDFGISKVLEDGTEGLRAGAQTSTQAVLGSPLYMSPEQVSSARDVDVRSDIWAMGVILYELLTHVSPFDGETAGAILANILTKDPLPPTQLSPEISRQLEAIVLRCMRRDREQRFQTARELMRVLAPHASRRIQALLLDPAELSGPLARTMSYGTPSGAIESARDGAVASSRVPSIDALPASATATSMSMSDPSVAARPRRWLMVGGAVVVASAAALAIWLLQSAQGSGQIQAAAEAGATATAGSSAGAGRAAALDAPPDATAQPDATGQPTGTAEPGETARPHGSPHPPPARVPPPTTRPPITAPPPTATKPPPDLLNSRD